MERSLVLVKPDAVQRGLTGTIISRMEGLGLKLVALKMVHIDRALAERHYAVHKEKAFFGSLVKYITSGPIVAMVLGGDAAVERIRAAMGSTDPAKAAKGTIRGDFGESIERNSVHGSDSPVTAENEIKLFFTDREIVSY